MCVCVCINASYKNFRKANVASGETVVLPLEQPAIIFIIF